MCIVRNALSSQNMILHVAARDGNYDQVMCSLHKSADERSKNMHGRTALEEALKCKQYHVFTLLYHPKNFIQFAKTQAHLYTQDEFDSFLDLSLCQDRSNFQIKNTLLHDCNRLAENKKHGTALMLAIDRCDVDSVNILLTCEDAEQQLFAMDARRNTCLHLVLFKTAKHPGKRYFLETIFLALVAATKDFKSRLRRDFFDIRNEDGVTALHIAVTNRFTMPVWKLTKFGTNPKICTRKNDTNSRSFGVTEENALFAAVNCHNSLIAIRVLTMGTMEVPFFPAIKDQSGRTLLIAALQTGNFDVAKFLIETVDVNSDDSKEMAPCPDCSKDGDTALHWAAYHSNFELCSILMKEGGSTTTKNANHLTPHQMAFVRSNKQYPEYSVLAMGHENGNTPKAPRKEDCLFEECQKLLRADISKHSTTTKPVKKCHLSWDEYQNVIGNLVQNL
jgi:ankyrin repeat protein